MFHVKHSEVVILKKTAYERERERIKRIQRKLKKQGLQVSDDIASLPTLKQLRKLGIKGESLRKATRALKKITEKSIKEKATDIYIPDGGQIIFDNFKDDFVNRFGTLTSEEEQLFRNDDDGKSFYDYFYNKLSQETEELTGVLRRRPSAVVASKTNQSFLISLLKEEVSKNGESTIGWRLADAGLDELTNMIQFILYGSSEGSINRVSDDLASIIKGESLSIKDKIRLSTSNDIMLGW